MMYLRLNKMEYSLNEIMIENCYYIYFMDVVNIVEFGYVVIKGL